MDGWVEQVPQGNNDASRLIDWLIEEIEWLIDWYADFFLLLIQCYDDDDDDNDDDDDDFFVVLLNYMY